MYLGVSSTRYYRGRRYMLIFLQLDSGATLPMNRQQLVDSYAKDLS